MSITNNINTIVVHFLGGGGGGNSQNGLLILVVLIPIAILFFYFHKKKKANSKSALGNNPNASSEKKDEVWRTIKQFLKSEGINGKEIVSSYVIRRPDLKDLHNRLKDALIYEAKQKAKAQKIKFIKPKIPTKFELEDYFSKLYEENNPSNNIENNKQIEQYTPQKIHRQKLINKYNAKNNRKPISNFFSKIPVLKKFISKNVATKEREIYVVIFKTKDSKTSMIDKPRALEVEVINEKLSRKDTKRQILINSEVNLDKEMAWIRPIKDEEDKKFQKEEAERLKREAKADIYKKKKNDGKIWYQKFLPNIALKWLNAIPKNANIKKNNTTKKIVKANSKTKK